MQRKLCFVTTNDNPYNPITQYDKWYSYDLSHHYNTVQYFGALFFEDDYLTDSIHDDEVERICDEIVKYCPLKNYKKVVEYVEVEESEVPDEYLPLKEDIVDKNKNKEPVGGS